MSNNTEHIDRLIARYLSGEATIEEKSLLYRWMDESPENKKYFGDIQFVHEKSIASHKVIKVDTELAWNVVSGKMKKNNSIISSSKVPSIKAPIYRTIWFRIAATILLVIGISAIFYIFIQKKYEYKTEWEISSFNSIINHTIKGNTQIILNKNSQISYRTKNSGKYREFILSGEAYIQVTHSADTTLIIKANETFIRDIGTAFNIKNYLQNNTVEVYVEKGKVDFYTLENKGIIINAGETGVYNKSRREFTLKKSEISNNLSYKTKHFVFRNTRLADVLIELNKVYTEQIILSNPALADCPLTVTFDDESVGVIVSVISEALGIESAKKGSTYILNGEKCQTAPE